MNSAVSWKQDVTWWLESNTLLRRLLWEVSHPDVEVRLVRVKRSGHNRKLVIETERTRFVCHVSLRRAFIRYLEQMHRLAASHALPIPAVLASGTTWRTCLPVTYLILQYIPGQPCKQPLSPTNLSSLGHVLGRLHSVTSDGWTNPGHARAGHRAIFFESQLTAWFKMTCELARLFGFACRLDERRLHVWLETQGRFVRALNEYHLMHGDIHGGNVLLNDQHNINLIDTDTFHFGVPGVELVHSLMQSYCGSEARLQLELLKGYRQVVIQKVWTIWEQQTTFLAVVAFLELAQRKIRTGRRRARLGLADAAKRNSDGALKLWAAAQHIVERYPDGRASWPEIMAVFAEAGN